MHSISLKLPASLNVKLDRAAKQRKKSKSVLVREALEEYLSGGSAASKQVSALDRAGDLVGCVDGPGDLSTGPRHMKGFGA